MSKAKTLNDLQELINDAEETGTIEARWEAVAAVDPQLVQQLTHPDFVPNAANLSLVATGTPVSPGAASGLLCLSADSVLAADERGDKTVLVCSETTPADEIGMRLTEGIITARGGISSHAAVVARGWGIPAVVGVSLLEIKSDHVIFGGVKINEGEPVSLDGTSGEVFSGFKEVTASEKIPELEKLLDWADEIRGERIGVLANADTEKDLATALAFGAEGVGLCRTEHMFLGDRLPLIQRFLNADDSSAENVLEELEETQRSDFVKLLRVAGSLPVTVRLLDAPLHEFAGTSHPDSEHNPMLGTRGVRLALLRHELYRMQARSITKAISDLVEEGKEPSVLIMIPLVVEKKELQIIRSWIEEEIAETVKASGLKDLPRIGTMIETPRAALSASEIAKEADFFSFGTNDLTQMVFGFSRDDIEKEVMDEYLKLNILSANPFKILDEEVVVPLIAAATRAARISKPGIEVGVCGEHGGDPASIDLLVKTGVDYVSCSPFRIPVARLATAQSLIKQDKN